MAFRSSGLYQKKNMRWASFSRGVLAVQNIGGTMTSVLGAMEPVTAVCIGALIFGEEFTMQEGWGIFLILVAVTLIVLTRTIQKSLSTVVRKIRPRHA